MASGGVPAGRAYVLFEVIDKTAKGMSAISKRLGNMSVQITNIGRQLTFAGAAITTPMVMAINSAKDLTDELLALKAVLRADNATMDDLEKKIRGLGKSTSFTSIEVAQAATNLARGGFSSQEIRGSLQNVLDLARGGQLEMSTAARIMVDSIRNFGLTTADAERVADSFFIAATKGTITVEELAQSFKFSGGTMAELGLNLETGLAVLSQLSKAMLKGTVGGTSFNQMLLALGTNAEKLKDIGINPFDSAGNVKEPLALFTELASVLRSMPPAERLPIMADIFNVRGMRAAAGVARMIDDINDAYQELSRSTGRAREASITMDSGIGGSIRRIISAATDMKESVGIAFTETFRLAENTIVPLLNKLSEWAAKNEEVFVDLLKLSLGITALGVALIALGGFLTTVSGLVAAASWVMSALAGTAGIVSLVMLGLASNAAIVGATFYSVWGRVKKETLELGSFFQKTFKEVEKLFFEVADAAKKVLAEIDLEELTVMIIHAVIPAIKAWVTMWMQIMGVLRTGAQLISGILILNLKIFKGTITALGIALSPVTFAFKGFFQMLTSMANGLSDVSKEATNTKRALKFDEAISDLQKVRDGLIRLSQAGNLSAESVKNINAELDLTNKKITFLVKKQKELFGQNKSGVNRSDFNSTKNADSVRKKGFFLPSEMKAAKEMDERQNKHNYIRALIAERNKSKGSGGSNHGSSSAAPSPSDLASGPRGKTLTREEIKNEKERQEKLASLQKKRNEALRDRSLEDREFKQSQEEDKIRIKRQQKDKASQLSELADLEMDFNRETDKDKKRQIEEQYRNLKERILEQMEDEKLAIEAARIAEAKRLESRRRETERILEIEKEIVALGGRVGSVKTPTLPPASKPPTVTLDPRSVAIRKLITDLGTRRSRLEAGRETIAQSGGRATVGVAIDASSVFGLATAFGNNEEQKQSALLEKIDAALANIERREAEAVAALRELPPVHGG